MDIIINDNIDIKAFTNANIYEKENKVDDIYIKYYNKTLSYDNTNEYIRIFFIFNR